MAEKEDAEGQLQKQRAVYDEAQALWAAEAMSMEERAQQQEDKIAEARQEAEAAQQEVRHRTFC